MAQLTALPQRTRHGGRPRTALLCARPASGIIALYNIPGMLYHEVMTRVHGI